jgi:hypothetical protein
MTEDEVMMKYFMSFVLAFAIAPMVLAEAPVSPSVDYMSASFQADGKSALNVHQLSSPDSRLRYMELGGLMAQSGGDLSELGDDGLFPASSSDGSLGMTTFDGSSITVNVPADLPSAYVGPVRVPAVSSNIRGVWSSPNRAQPVKTYKDPVYGASPWTQSGGKPLGPEHYLPRRNMRNR